MATSKLNNQSNDINFNIDSNINTNNYIDTEQNFIHMNEETIKQWEVYYT